MKMYYIVSKILKKKKKIFSGIPLNIIVDSPLANVSVSCKSNTLNKLKRSNMYT